MAIRHRISEGMLTFQLAVVGGHWVNGVRGENELHDEFIHRTARNIIGSPEMKKNCVGPHYSHTSRGYCGP